MEETADTQNAPAQPAGNTVDQGGKDAAQLVYILYAIGIAIGLAYVAGVIVAYVKKDDFQDEFTQSHFSWQIRTFWFSALWLVIGAITAILMVGYVIMIADMIWVIYRIVKGWLRLTEGRPMYQD